jgi:hypothetical protein
MRGHRRPQGLPGRESIDDDVNQGVVLRRSASLAAAAILLAVGSAQGADLVTFLRLMLEHGAAAEANPLAHAGAAQLGLLPLIVAKVALVVFVTSVFVVVVTTRPRVGLGVAAAAVTAGLVGAFSNVLAL